MKLFHCRKIVVIPEHWIYDLNSSTLKNIGANRNHKRLIYFNKSEAANIDFPPNFHLNVLRYYDADAEEACYHATMVKFWGML